MSSWGKSWSLINPLMRLKHAVPGLTITREAQHSRMSNFQSPMSRLQRCLKSSIGPITFNTKILNKSKDQVWTLSHLWSLDWLCLCRLECYQSVVSASPASVIIRVGAGAGSSLCQAQARPTSLLQRNNLVKICELKLELYVRKQKPAMIIKLILLPTIVHFMQVWLMVSHILIPGVWNGRNWGNCLRLDSK